MRPGCTNVRPKVSRSGRARFAVLGLVILLKQKPKCLKGNSAAEGDKTSERAEMLTKVLLTTERPRSIINVTN